MVHQCHEADLVKHFKMQNLAVSNWAEVEQVNSVHPVQNLDQENLDPLIQWEGVRNENKQESVNMHYWNFEHAWIGKPLVRKLMVQVVNSF